MRSRQRQNGVPLNTRRQEASQARACLKRTVPWALTLAGKGTTRDAATRTSDIRMIMMGESKM